MTTECDSFQGRLTGVPMTAAEWNVLESTIRRLTPQEQLELIERVARIMRAIGGNPANGSRQEALDALRQEMAALPVRNPADGFSNRDHDALLYGDTP